MSKLFLGLTLLRGEPVGGNINQIDMSSCDDRQELAKKKKKKVD